MSNLFKKYENKRIRLIIKEYGEVLDGNAQDVEASYRDNYPECKDIKIISLIEIEVVYQNMMENIQVLKDSGYDVNELESQAHEFYYNNLMKEEEK